MWQVWLYDIYDVILKKPQDEIDEHVSMITPWKFNIAPER